MATNDAVMACFSGLTCLSHATVRQDSSETYVSGISKRIIYNKSLKKGISTPPIASTANG